MNLMKKYIKQFVLDLCINNQLQNSVFFFLLYFDQVSISKCFQWCTKEQSEFKVEDIPVVVDVESDEDEDVKPPTKAHHREEQDEHILYRGKWHAFKESKNFYRNSIDVAQKMLVYLVPVMTN